MGTHFFDVGLAPIGSRGKAAAVAASSLNTRSLGSVCSVRFPLHTQAVLVELHWFHPHDMVSRGPRATPILSPFPYGQEWVGGRNAQASRSASLRGWGNLSRLVQFLNTLRLMRSGCHASLPPLDCFGHGFVEIKRTQLVGWTFCANRKA